jgi:predicted Zn-dependent protease
MSQPPADDKVPRYPSNDYCIEIANRVIGFATRKSGTDGTSVRVTGNTHGNLRWVRNQVSTSGQQVNRDVWITSISGSHTGVAMTNETTDVALKSTATRAEALANAMANNEKTKADTTGALAPQEYGKAMGFYQKTADHDMAARSAEGKELVQAALASGFMSFGFLEHRAMGTGVNNSNKLTAYYGETMAGFSTTVRSGKTEGSGWAGMSHEDLDKVDVKALMARAIDKCNKSQNPVKMEPGRYTAILEPQAVADLFGWAFWPYIFGMEQAEAGVGPYAAPNGQTKIGKQMLDRRVSIYSDPSDPLMNFRPFYNSGAPIPHIDWWKDGFLQNLPFDQAYAVNHDKNNGREIDMPPYPLPVYHMTGGDTSIDEMIATTRTGFLVTRFNSVLPVEFKALMLSGNTRDGLWYIENGKVKHPAKNFRFNESPFFVLNQIESLGPVQRIYQPPAPASCPYLKVRNFNFSSLADAV